MATIISKDSLRSSVEAATGGLVTVLYDDAGHPNFMRRIPKIRIEDVYPDLGLTGTHPAFIVNGVEKSELFISLYANSIVDNVGVSLPGLDPAVNIKFEQAFAYCASKGAGWHLMSNAEWAVLQALALKTGFQPRGNSYWGLDYGLKYETGTLAPGAAALGAPDNARHGRTLTGSGPLSWRHDNSPAGIADLVGNISEWISGLRINDGEINIFPDNDVAVQKSQPDNSPFWKAILENGSLVAPGMANALSYNVTDANTIMLNNAKQAGGTATTVYCAFKDIGQGSITVPALVKILGLYPISDAAKGRLMVQFSGEHLPARGGYYADAANAGMFALDIHGHRGYTDRFVGFRSAFIL